ncbi:tensin homolog isoform X2 [Chironomus tepperi]|uniref:tensin homolog isoform X2 n=1 Tax=Chironomus tepperi TaxID=113505 RepID=UPI00391F6F4F
MPWNCLCSSKKSKKSKYNNSENIKTVPENSEPEKKRKFYNNLRLDQCEKNPKTPNNSSSLDSQFDQKSINELNDHLYDSYDTLPNVKTKVDETGNKNKNLLNINNHNNSIKRTAKYDDDNVLRPKHLILCISNENLPFIDSPDSPGCSTRYHNDRVLQMMPHNLVLSSSSDQNDWERLHKMQQNKSTHKYIEIDVMDSQICQKCHKVLSFRKTFKCSLCDFTCHQHCADKTSNSYEDRSQQQQQQQTHLEKNETQQQQQQQSRAKTPTSTTPTGGNTWQLCYVTERILAAILPVKPEQSSKIDDLFLYDENGNRRGDKYELDLIQMLEQKHGKNYRLFDLESCLSTISLEKLCELCKHIETWLSGGQNKIVVLQDRKSFQRVATSVAAYLYYQKMCSSNLAPYSIKSPDHSRNIQDLDEYSMQKFLDDTAGPITQPSYKRYLEYFFGLLSGEIKINSQPLYLKFIKMESPPCMHHKISHHENEWSSFIKIFEGERFIFISDIYVMPISTKQFIYEIKSPIILRGDIFIHFFQIHNKSRQTELISSIQFHTCAIARNEIEFHKNDISFPHSDEKFPMDHKVTLIFTKTPDKINRLNEDVLIFQNPLIRKEPISNYSSIADLSQLNTQHTQGPVDGSLYATIEKRNANNNELTVQNIRTIETRLNAPISKNSRILSTILEWDNARNENGTMVDGNYSHTAIATRSSPRQEQQPTPPQRSYVKSPLMQSYDSGIYSHEISNKNNTSSALSWHDRATSPSANTCHDELDNLLSEMLLTVEALPDIAYSTEKSKQNSDVYTATTQTTTNTASMRSNAVDRTLPNNNQNHSPNVINNINTTNDQRSHTQRSYSYSDAFGYSKNNDIGETSSITTTLTPTESGRNTPALSDQQYKGFYANNDELYYDTDTQMQLHGKSTRYQHSLPDDTRKEYQKRSENLLQNQSLGYMEVLRSENNISGSRRYEESNVPYHAREYSKPFSYLPSTADGKIIRMQHGLSSPSMVRKALNLNGSVTSGRKNLSQDFVERTRYGRQYESKYTFGDKTPENNLSVFDNEKLFDYRNRSENVKYKDSANYSIENSDVESSAHYFEPLKRSNTMDGSFGRSGYASDGGSSQTWLQVQQQRLRAKRAQRQQGFDFTDGAARRSQTLSPVRNYNTLTTGKEPKYVQIKRTEQTVSKPYKNELENNPFDFQNRTASYTRSFNDKNSASTNSINRRNIMPLTSTPNEEMDRINNNNLESPKSPMETLDNLLESIAYENYTTNNFLTELINGTDTNGTSRLISNNHINNNNIIINQKTDSVNRYLDNVINFNHEQSSYHNHNNIRKSDSEGSSSDHNNGKMPHQTRNESVSSYRSETETEFSRPETPAFPVTPRTPVPFGSTSTLPPKSPTLQRRDLSNRIHEVANVNETVSTYASRRNSTNSAISNANSELFEIAPHHVKFARDSSKYWYKPSLSREEAISLLRNATPGTFLVRDSTTFANAFGLVVRVAQPPPGSKGGSDELVRHFLVEPTVRGVRLKGCSNEPVFSSLSALIYQHSVTPLALPCRLNLPERDIQQREYQTSAQQQLAVQGAACNVLYLFSADTESLTGPQAVRKAVRLLFERRPLPTPTEVHFKVSNQGVTLTDNSRQLFFRKHYPATTITYIGIDPDDHRWSVHVTNSDVPVKNQHIFAFVAKKTATSSDNQCHIFCELEMRQPATAITSFAQKVLMDESARQQHAPAQI